MQGYFTGNFAASNLTDDLVLFCRGLILTVWDPVRLVITYESALWSYILADEVLSVMYWPYWSYILIAFDILCLGKTSDVLEVLDVGCTCEIRPSCTVAFHFLCNKIACPNSRGFTSKLWADRVQYGPRQLCQFPGMLVCWCRLCDLTFGVL